MAKTKKTEVEASEELVGGAKKGKNTKPTKTTKQTQKKTPVKAKATKKGKAGSKTVKKTEKRKRYFKLLDKGGSKSIGRYTGETPKQAASKAFTKLSQKLKNDGKKIPKENQIFLRESTRGSNRKVYGYSASKNKLKTPQELHIKDKVTGEKKTIIYNYRNNIRKIAVPESMGGGAKKNKKAAAGSKSKKGAAKKAATKKGASKKVSDKKQPKKEVKKTTKAPAQKAKGQKAKAAK